MYRLIIAFLLAALFAGCHKDAVKVPVAAYDGIEVPAIYYEQGTAAISGRGFGQLIDAIDAIRANGNARFMIVGIADDFKTVPECEELGRHRAKSVLHYLIGYGFKPERFEIVGRKGEAKSVRFEEIK